MYLRNLIINGIVSPTPDLSNMDPFNILQEIDVSNNTMLQENGASAYNFFLVVGIIGLIITGTYCGLKIAMHGKAERRSEAKSELGFKALLALGLFTFIFLIGIVLKIAQSLT